MLFKDFAWHVFNQYGCVCIGVEFPPEDYTHVRAENSSAAIAEMQSNAGGWNRFRETVYESNLGANKGARDSARVTDEAPREPPKGLAGQLSEMCARRPTVGQEEGEAPPAAPTMPPGIPQLERSRSSLQREMKKDSDLGLR